MRMGLNDLEPKTLAEIGTIFGISRQRVEQLEKQMQEQGARLAELEEEE